MGREEAGRRREEAGRGREGVEMEIGEEVGMPEVVREGGRAGAVEAEMGEEVAMLEVGMEVGREVGVEAEMGEEAVMAEGAVMAEEAEMAAVAVGWNWTHVDADKHDTKRRGSCVSNFGHCVLSTDTMYDVWWHERGERQSCMFE